MLQPLFKLSPQGINTIFHHLSKLHDTVFWIRDKECKQQVFVSDGFQQLWEHDCTSLYQNPNSWGDYLVNATSKDIEQLLIQSEDSSNSLVYAIKIPSGDVKWIRDMSFTLCNEDKILGIAGIAMEIPKNEWNERTPQLIQEKQSILDQHFSKLLLANFGFNKLTPHSKEKKDSKIKKTVIINEHTINLSMREVQCIDYLFKGASAKVIARELQLSPRTIETYIDRIKVKLDCRTRLEVIAKIKDSEQLQLIK